MNFYPLIFPAPKCSYNTDFEDLIFIPGDIDHQIPAIFIKGPNNCKHIMLYFHANAEDIGICHTLLKLISEALEINSLLIEYPTYGIYNSKSISEQQVYKDSEYCLDFVLKILKFKPENVIITGRSIGSGPAVYLASKNKLCPLILISPFKSVQEVASNFVGNFLSFIIKNIFLNGQIIKESENPMLILHGEHDEIIPYYHGKYLYNNSKSINKMIIKSEHMTHNNFNIINDIVNPIIYFLNKLDSNCETDIHLPKLEYLEYFKK